MEQPLSLTTPSDEFQSSFETYVTEIQSVDSSPMPFVLTQPYDNFADYIELLKGFSKGIGMPDGFVPQSTFWLIDPAHEIVGMSSLRHSLTEKLRREGGHIGYGVRPSRRKNGYGTILLGKTLKEAIKLELKRVLITCDGQNIASRRVIERNGGIFDSEEHLPEREVVVRRYWIDFQ